LSETDGGKFTRKKIEEKVETLSVLKRIIPLKEYLHYAVDLKN